METKKSIVVLGGGITGLAAAWYLQKHSDHFDVTLFEKSDRLGGVIGSHREGNWLVERGADNFATLIPDALELTRELGLEGEMIRPNEANRLARVVAHGNLCPIPQGFSLMQPTRMDAILASRVLSLPASYACYGNILYLVELIRGMSLFRILPFVALGEKLLID